MFMPTGGGGKGNRPQSTHQQNHSHQNQHHQATHAHSHPHPHHHHQTQQQQQQQQQQSRTSHLHQQQEQQQQQPTHTVFVPQQNTNLGNLHQHHHPLPQQQQHQQPPPQQHHLQQQPIIFYPSQPPPPLPYTGHAQHSSSSSSNGSNGGAALQLSGAASNSSLAHGHGHGNSHHGHGHGQAHANGVLTPTSSNSSLVRTISNPTLPPHFPQPASLIAPPGSGAGGAGATYISTAFLPFNHPGQLISAPPVAFAPNGPAGTPAGGFFAAAPPQHKQQSGQQHGINTGAAPSAAQAQAIAYYHHSTLPPAQLTNNNGNNKNSGGGGGNGAHRGNMRGGQRSTPPQQTSYYTAYAVPTAPTAQRPTLVNNGPPTVTPILNARNGALNGTPTFHIPPTYSIPIGPPPNLTTTPMMAAAGMTAPPPAGATGLHTYAPHLQSSSATAVAAVTGVATAFSSTSLTAPQQLAGGDKVKERRHAIPIIHPDTKENVLDPNSSVFIKKDSNSALASSTGSDCNIPQYQSDNELDPASTAALVLAGVMVDHQMQTEKAALAATENQGLPPLTDEDKVSVIVKDILAHSGNPEEHLSFWQYNDVEITTENPTELTPAAATTGAPVLFKESLSSKKLRPKSVNKQSTATPTSIANAVAEAAATATGVIILASSTRQTLPSEQKNSITMGEGSNTVSDSEPIPASPIKLLQSKSEILHLPSTSSSAASSPTHQQKPQAKALSAVKSANAVLSPSADAGAAANLSGAAAAVPPNNSSSKKSQRKAQKRKEQEKKKQKAAAVITNSSAPSINNNVAKSNAPNSAKATSNNAGTAGAETSITFVTKTKTTAAVTSVVMDKAAPTTTDRLNATSNNSSLSSSLRDTQSKEHQQNSLTNSCTSNNDTAVSELGSNNKENDLALQQDKHMANEDIVAKFLQKSFDDAPSQAEPQLEFLNSSSSMCEDEEALNSAKKINLSDRSTDIANKSSESNVEELKFGDFNEEAPSHNSSFICSSTWSSSQPPEVSSSQITMSQDNVDCAAATISSHKIELPLNAGISGKKNSPVHQSSKTLLNPKASVPKISGVVSKVTSKMAIKLIRYNIEELRELSKLSDSRKPPMVPCQKGDCIAQLFVSRQSQQQQQHHHGHSQMYPHISDFMDHVSGKRGRGHGHGQNKKHHDGHQSMGGNSGGNNAGGGGMGGSNQRHMDIIRVQLSLKEEIKLSECENAWQPETLRRVVPFSASEMEQDDEGVIKKVRGILNKLTPDNFDVLLKEMSGIKMDTQAKMTNVMLLIFEKTISEPNFAPTYARFCKVLFHEIKAENKSLFTSSLITRIQHEFESNVNDANAKAKKLQPTQERMNACTDTAKKAELRAEMEDLEYQFRRRAWGTVRFIGELFKLQSLTSDRVLHCVESLLEHGCEEKLEYMCKLLTTVGHLLESSSPDQYQNGVRIEKIFRRIQDIVQRSRSTNSNRPHQLNIKISSRVRFMMQDVLDLRARNWDQPVTHSTVAGRQQRHKQHDEPKAQQQQQPQQQQHGGRGAHLQQQQQSNYQYQQQKQHHHHHGHDSGNYFMQKLPKAQQHENQALSIDPNKLRFSSSNNDDATAKLGNSSHYQWRSVGNRPVSSAQSPTPSLLKRAAPVSNVSYSTYQQQQQQQQSSPAPVGNRNNNTENVTEAPLEPKQCEQLLKNLVENTLGSRDWQGNTMAIWHSTVSKQQQAVSVIHYVLMDYVHKTQVKRPQRLACANVFAYLMQQAAFDKNIFAQAYTRFGEEFPDLLVDVPNGWSYVFEFLGPIMHDDCLKFEDIWQQRWLEDSQFTERFVRAFVSYFVQEFGAGYTHKLWHVNSKLDRGQMFWSDARKYRDFLQSNSFQFLEPNSTGTAGMQRSRHTRTPDQHVERISYLLTLSSDTAIDYINTNVHINVIFVSQLTKFLCCDFALKVIANPPAMKNNNNNNNNLNTNKNKLQLNLESFKSQCTPLLRLCIDAQEAHEIACIDATVESLMQHLVELEDEVAAGDTICSTLTVLYDCEVISRDSFNKWFNHKIEPTSCYRRHFVDKLRALIKEM